MDLWPLDRSGSTDGETTPNAIGGRDTAPGPEGSTLTGDRIAAVPVTVRLVPMTDEEYSPFLDGLYREYAADHVRAGRWTEAEGEQKAREEIGKLLPDGRQTANHLLLTIRVDPGDEPVGAVWIAFQPPSPFEPHGAFVYDLEIRPAFRRRGYAEEAMRALEPIARDRGFDHIRLHVFGDNAGARHLYRKLGYVETNVLMAKALGLKD